MQWEIADTTVLVKMSDEIALFVKLRLNIAAIQHFPPHKFARNAFSQYICSVLQI